MTLRRPYDPTPEQRAAMERAKNGRSLLRAWHGREKQKDRDPETVVPKRDRPVRL